MNQENMLLLGKVLQVVLGVAGVAHAAITAWAFKKIDKFDEKVEKNESKF